jgi:tape measure domain-containing protein
MANIAELNIRLGVRFRDFDRSMRQVENRLKQTAQSMDGIANSMAQSFTAPFLAIGALAIKAAGDFEALKLAMQTTMKDAGYSTIETTKELEALRKVALAPGIDLQQAVKGSIALQSVGFSAERARKTLEQLANGVAAAGGSAENLEGVVKQFAQISAKGTVLQEDLGIIKENMPSVVKAMREAFGTTTAEGIRNAGVSADQFIDGITKQLAKNERVQGGIKNAIDNTRSAITQFFAAIGDGINEAYNLNAVAGAMSEKVGKLAEMFKNLDPETKKSIFNFALYAAAFPVIIKGLALMYGAGQQVVAGIRLLSGGIQTGSAAILGMADKWGKLSAVMKFSYVGAAIAIVAALYLGFQKLTDETEKALHTTRLLEGVERDANAQIGEQKVRVQTLIGVLNDENRTKQEKIAALDTLNQISPEYFGNLKLENGQVVGLTASYDGYINNLLRAARAKAAEGKLIEIDQKKAEAQKELLRLQKAGSGNFQQSTGGFGSVTAFDQGASSTRNQNISEAARAVSALEQEEKALRGVIEANLDLTPRLAATTKGNKAVGDSAKSAGEKTKSISAIFKEVSKDLDDINKKAAALGATGGEDHFDDFAKGIESGISKLVEAGAKVDGKEITALKQLAREGLGAQLVAPDLLPTAATAQSVGTRSAEIPDVRIAYDKDALNEFLSDSQRIGQVLEQMKSGFISASEGFDAINAILATTNENFTGTGLKMQEMSFAFQALGEQFQMLGQSFQAGGDAQKAIFDAVGASIADLTNEGSVNMKDFAKAAVLSSIKVAKAYAVQGIFAAVSKALQSVPFPINLIAAAGAAGVASALLNGLANKISAPKLAKGGLAYGETLAMVGDNPNASVDPEVIAPLSKLKDIIGGGASDIMVGGTFRIRGEDLELVLQKAKTTKQRRYGNG